MTDTAAAFISHLKGLANPDNVAGMARFGIHPKHALGLSIPTLRALAKAHRGDHSLALELWKSGIHEARLLAAFVDDPRQVTESQMEKWAKDFDSWDVCDQVCSNLFDKTPFACQKAMAWSKRSEEFVKRAGFVLMASLAVHDKEAEDAVFKPFLREIAREAVDPRNYVCKAVNWALRQIGKRDRNLHGQALKLAVKLAESKSSSARWVGKDALRELQNVKVVTRIRK